MKSSLNNITLAGNVVRDIDVKYLGANNTCLITCTIANNKSYRKDGEWISVPVYIDVKIWKKEYLAERIHKGSLLFVSGAIEQENWEDKEGSKRSKILINAHHVDVFNKDEEQSSEVNNQQPVTGAVTDDDMPF
jgi:single-strand DNA-binding protein